MRASHGRRSSCRSDLRDGELRMGVAVVACTSAQMNIREMREKTFAS